MLKIHSLKRLNHNAHHLTSALVKRVNCVHTQTMASVESTLAGKYPAKAHARKVVEYIQSKHSNASGVIYLEGQKTRMIEDSDEAQPFRYLITIILHLISSKGVVSITSPVADIQLSQDNGVTSTTSPDAPSQTATSRMTFNRPRPRSSYHQSTLLL